MPQFTYTARDAKGEMKQATIEAPNRDEVMSQLKKQKLQVIKVDEGPATKKKAGGKIKRRDIVIFTRQFSTMINSGLPLVQALDILANQSENPALKDVCRQVVFDVESGNTLADALRKHPKAFDELYVNMVAAGESGGILDTILLRLAVFIEKNDALVSKVKGAMIYPGVIMTVAGGAISILLIFVIPTFQKMFGEAGIALPLPTQIVIGISKFLRTPPPAPGGWLVIGVAFFGFKAFKKYKATTDGALKVDQLMLKVPILGDVIRKSAVSRFTRTLGTMISSGVSILEGLEITAKTSGNRVVQDAIMESRASIAGGDTISAPLKKSGVFPPMVISMINVGEQTGGLDEMLTKIADFYDGEVDTAVSGLLAMMEPMMIVFLGVVVGGMVIAMYLPIFDMVNAAG
jgi:type IV pilus assembly protein PilC